MHRPTRGSREPAVVALMATRGRGEVFLRRSVGSIAAQTRLPDRLIVVDDSEPLEARRPFTKETRRLVTALMEGLTPATLLRNFRTRGPSGAWNTGIDWLHRNFEDASNVFVAILDDDDAWEPAHLAACLKRAVEDDLDMVAAGLVRVEQLDQPGRLQSIPHSLDRQRLLAEGQHIQGSNLFVRLDRLLMAGLFDEHLMSCTDRDLVLRLGMLDGFRFGALEQHTARHYADPRSDRCSAPGSPAKLDGLSEFHAKWLPWMTAETARTFTERSRRLFGWTPPSGRPEKAPTRNLASTESVPSVDVSLVVGVIVDPSSPRRVAPLLEQLLRLRTERDLAGLDVLLLENGAADADDAAIREVVRESCFQGLRCFLIGREQQHRDAAGGVFGSDIERGASRLPIAQARTLVAVYAARHARRRTGSWVWLLDDDVRLDAFADGDVAPSIPDFAELYRLKADGIRIVYGPITGAPPVPFVTCLRSQTVDALHLLGGASVQDAHATLPDVAERHERLRELERDYYYDLSRRGTQLQETPFPIAPARAGETYGEAVVRIGSTLGRALAGEQVTRPLVADAKFLPKPSILRGASALWFEPEDLLLVPNAVAQIGGAFTRRSDMLVALISKEVVGLRSVQSPAIAVRQDRGDVAPAADFEKLRTDILGYAFYSALTDVLGRADRVRRSAAHLGALEFDRGDLALALRQFRKYVDERCYALSLSAWRLQGVASAGQRLAEEPTVAEKIPAYARRSVAEQLSTIAAILTPATARDVLSRCREAADDEVLRAFGGLSTSIRRYQAAGARELEPPPTIEDQRREIARQVVLRRFGQLDLRVLGSGSEGVVLTDDQRVFKVVDYWKSRSQNSQKRFLSGLVGRTRGSAALPEIEAFVDDCESTILVTRFIPSEPYVGGHGPGLIRLLREARRFDLVCRNIHPKNLRVAGDDVLLIDYGADLRPFAADEFRKMAKRAWLSFRCHDRSDLGQLMRRSITSDELPELAGFERFFAAIDVPDLGSALDPLVVEALGDVDGKSVLDFGCGKGRLASALAAGGAAVTGYDPDVRHADRWRIATASDAGRLCFSADRTTALARGPFQRVVSSLVLCEIQDPEEFRQALADLRGSLTDDGVAVVAVCDPRATFGGPTPLHSMRRRPPEAKYDDTFVFEEGFGGVRRRLDVHRPQHVLEQELGLAGFTVEAMRRSETVDLERFEPASDFLVLKLRPSAVASRLDGSTAANGAAAGPHELAEASANPVHHGGVA